MDKGRSGSGGGFTFSREEKAFVAPFLVFALLMTLPDGAKALFPDSTHPLIEAPQHWVYPLQTLLCGFLLWRFWPVYQMRAPRRVLSTIAIGVVVFGIWVMPHPWSVSRLEGFDPTLFGEGTATYYAVVAVRFLRLVIVVPLLEEIFWRGFLLRYLIDDHFTRQPIGAFTWRSFAIVSLAFGAAHWGPDFGVAIITGAIYNGVAYWTRSLSSCVLVHAVTNLVLGIYIMQTRQWGFW
jgi:CAAX prenyl protease-like protein